MSIVCVPLRSRKHPDLVAIVDEEDAGRVLAHAWYPKKSRRGEFYAYAAIGSPRKNVFLHCFILGAPPGVQVDHQNHDGLDCRRENLRHATHGQNQHNQRKQVRPTTSRFKGVYWHKRDARWIAQIQFDGERIPIGRFSDETAAAIAYDERARELFGEFAFLNFPDGAKGRASA